MSSDKGPGGEAVLERVDPTGRAVPRSPAGAISAEEAAALPAPPTVPLARHLQVLRFNQRHIEFVFKAQCKLGDVWGMRGFRDGDVVTSHPDHVRSLLHHREDLYPDPFAFRPERWEDRRPGTYEWIPFGGGIRRCLGAALAMADHLTRPRSSTTFTS